MKRIVVTDKDTGKVLEDVEFSGGYLVTVSNTHNDGLIRHIRKLDNGKFGDRHRIMNYYYRPIAQKLVEKFGELSHVVPEKILFLEDTEWQEKSAKRSWIARIMLANKQLKGITGYEYVAEFRRYYMEHMEHEQVVATVYHELRHIDTDGSLIKHDIEDWGNMVATLGKDWAITKAKIANILSEDFHEWTRLPEAGTQISLFRELRVVK